jgi:transcriptional regulator with XRE-family HTH domain
MVGALQQTLGRNLRRLRVERQLSQEELAELLRVHRTYVGGLERGERNPSLRVIERLAEELHIEPLDLLQDGDTAARPMLRAAASGEPGSVPDARSLPTGRRPRPPA